MCFKDDLTMQSLTDCKVDYQAEEEAARSMGLDFRLENLRMQEGKMPDMQAIEVSYKTEEENAYAMGLDLTLSPPATCLPQKVTEVADLEDTDSPLKPTLGLLVEMVPVESLADSREANGLKDQGRAVKSEEVRSIETKGPVRQEL